MIVWKGVKNESSEVRKDDITEKSFRHPKNISGCRNDTKTDKCLRNNDLISTVDKLSLALRTTTICQWERFIWLLKYSYNSFYYNIAFSIYKNCIMHIKAGCTFNSAINKHFIAY